MEKIPAASAIEWSIELEKGLRSKKPGKSIKEILKVGSRLEQWSRESKVVFDNGDVEERVLALALFGCLADFSFASDHTLEVKASLFAAGCFSLLNKALKVLHKILLHNLPSFSTSGISDVFSEVLTFTKEMIQCSVLSKQILSALVVDFSRNLLVRAKESTMVFQVISLIMNQISMLVKSEVDVKQIDAEIEQEVTSLFNLVQELAERHSDVGGLLLDKFCIFIVYLGNMFDMRIDRNKEDVAEQESSNFGRESNAKVVLKFSLSVTRL
ncbi:hypothetical protein M9H77_16468 [Catharanthus roseus]|uniref:Uncharacterized protein n=1 Tax=Catharanthus roseus TaxID=4058 RepID=A0ACC0B1U8_CATRO|nr:hypothetical protein M9H77_16468 [Catharanthus roseus]